MSQCPITGDAEVERVHGETPDRDELRWVRADPETHLSKELLNGVDERGYAFLTARYQIGERCPYQAGMFHARLRTRGEGEHG